ncbi:Leucine-rich repeat-containing protein 40 [Cytospora mali]|uniref:Leucine-rich repeat-containing protein 40 n=1 Tax=Cytospora mali TaxID=578113 RepID=A0A194V7N2_CYTMA|nr:Leucine-rich repeat-containing protein 40 [Valsa mali var. pyri (nom. inval.)]
MVHPQGLTMTEDPELSVPAHVQAPSSPPETHQPREEREASLPPIPAVSWDAQTQSFAKRKRSTASQIFSDSSDPAIFSSDDDPALDNYVEGRRNKKRYVGSWFQQHPAPGSPDSGISHRPASRAKRNFVPVDSGVFMGSDGSIDDILDDLPPPRANTAVFPLGPAKPTPIPLQLNQVPRGSQTSQLSEAEAKAQVMIRRCIDNGDERVDLSCLGLKHISNSTIAMMSEIARIPNVGKGVPFEHQDPELKLFLWNNQLTQVPKAVFNLDHLTVLSLRGNSLTEVPPAILQLKNLETLNLSQNKLKRLPVELLELIYNPESSLKSLMLHPNPWYQPEVEGSDVPWSSENVDRSQTGPGPQGRGCRWLSHSSLEPRIASYFDARRWARTPVQFSDTKGVVYSTFRFEHGTAQLLTEDLDSEPVLPPRNPAQERVLLAGEAKTTKVHSLLELALQACSRSPYLAELPGMLTDTTHDYARIRDLLVDTQAHSYTGGVECTVCKRSVIKPTAEWIEWWELFLNYKILGPRGTNNADQNRPQVRGSDMAEELVPRVQYLTQIPEERLVPFIRRACSWKCVLDTNRGLGRHPGGENE